MGRKKAGIEDKEEIKPELQEEQEYIEEKVVFYIGPAIADLVPFRFYKDIPYTGKRLIEKNSRYKRLFIDHAITDNKLREMLNNNITFRDIYNQALKEGV